MAAIYKDATLEEVDVALHQSWQAFEVYRQKTVAQRSLFLHAIADGLQQHKQALVAIAGEETNLDRDRLGGELQRTIFQLTSYADACAEGSWMDIRIDTADANTQPPRPDLRKMLVPLGPVVVFGASNFPFAYSTAGGDTACALAAGCTVVIKAHPAHAGTSEAVSNIILEAAQKQSLPKNVFIHLHGASVKVGEAVVKHPLAKAVGFTGSFSGGKALFDWAAARAVPIPVFAEMGSVNPVFILPEKLKNETESVATMYAASITQSAGQFCTNPGVLVAIESNSLQHFTQLLAQKINEVKPVKMLHPGIVKSFHAGRGKALATAGVQLLTDDSVDENLSLPTLATTPATNFLKNPYLHQEVFGPYSILVVCKNTNEMLQVAKSMEGQLTTTLMATEEEAKANPLLVAALQDVCGRFVMNGVPTGVSVALAMHHGGPYPATTDSRFTAVGADGIKRFARPVCFQNWPNDLLPDALKNENPLVLWRTVNNALTKQPIH